ncbi:MAG: hypothetical protein ACKV2V_14055, partial [Blastocatellia bacterium]
MTFRVFCFFRVFRVFSHFAGCRLALILLSLVLLPLPLSAQRRWPGTTARRRVPPPGQLSL